MRGSGECESWFTRTVYSGCILKNAKKFLILHSLSAPSAVHARDNGITEPAAPSACFSLLFAPSFFLRRAFNFCLCLGSRVRLPSSPRSTLALLCCTWLALSRWTSRQQQHVRSRAPPSSGGRECRERGRGRARLRARGTLSEKRALDEERKEKSDGRRDPDRANN